MERSELCSLFSFQLGIFEESTDFQKKVAFRIEEAGFWDE